MTAASNPPRYRVEYRPPEAATLVVGSADKLRWACAAAGGYRRRLRRIGETTGDLVVVDRQTEADVRRFPVAGTVPTGALFPPGDNAAASVDAVVGGTVPATEPVARLPVVASDESGPRVRWLVAAVVMLGGLSLGAVRRRRQGAHAPRVTGR